jgi:hypothetical protein
MNRLYPQNNHPDLLYTILIYCTSPKRWDTFFPPTRKPIPCQPAAAWRPMLRPANLAQDSGAFKTVEHRAGRRFTESESTPQAGPQPPRGPTSYSL